jgi:hypothetical protein
MKALAVALSVLAWRTGAAWADPLVMPQESIEHAAERGCRQVADPYEQRPGPVNAPSASVLMFLFKREGQALTRCPRSVQWLNPPWGRSLMRC